MTVSTDWLASELETLERRVSNLENANKPELMKARLSKVKVPAPCGVCGEPVQYAYYLNGQLGVEEGHGIASVDNVPYHYQPGKDCYGKYTGYPNFGGKQQK